MNPYYFYSLIVGDKSFTFWVFIYLQARKGVWRFTVYFFLFFYSFSGLTNNSVLDTVLHLLHFKTMPLISFFLFFYQSLFNPLDLIRIDGFKRVLTTWFHQYSLTLGFYWFYFSSTVCPLIPHQKVLNESKETIFR